MGTILQTWYAPSGYVVVTKLAKGTASLRKVTVIIVRQNVSTSRHLTRIGIDLQAQQTCGRWCSTGGA